MTGLFALQPPVVVASHGPARRQPAPGGLERVRAFVNTLDVEEGTDALAMTDWARAWVRDRLDLDVRPLRERDRERLVAFRNALRDVITTRDTVDVSDRTRRALDALAAASPLTVMFTPDGEPRLQPTGRGIDLVLGLLLREIVEAAAAGTWERLKICRNDACAWAYYDASRNRSGVWCSMAICGNRMKGRSFRRRQASTAS